MPDLAIAEDWLEILIAQQVNLMRDGKRVQMSKRAGEYVTLDDLVTEVGADAARFFFLMRRSNSHLDFDLDLAKKTSDENPVYYVQYAHARICSMVEFAGQSGVAASAADLVRARRRRGDRPHQGARGLRRDGQGRARLRSSRTGS